MNTVSPPQRKPRAISPLMWAGLGTLLLHSAFLLALYLWPRPPAKARESLLEVNFTKEKTEKAAPTPTSPPLKLAKLPVLPRPTTRPEAQPTPRAQVKPLPVPKTRVAKIIVLKPAPTRAQEVPTPVPVETPPTAKPAAAPTSVPAQKAKTRSQTPGSAAPLKTKTRDNKAASSGQSPAKGTPNPTSAPSNSREESAAPSGGAGGRRFARNDEEPDAPARSRQSASANKGSNARGKSDETAGAQSGVDLPRTRSRRGRSAPVDALTGSAPASSKDGTEVNIGPSSPTSSAGGSRRASTRRGDGDGDEARGAARRGGLPGASGSQNRGNDARGRGDDEAAGNGVSGGRRGSGVRGAGRGKGRRGTRLAGDPFGSGGGNGGYGKGDGADGADGTGQGPRGNGTRLARNGRGGNSDGDGNGQFGRGTGSKSGDGLGRGDGAGGTGTGTGRGSEDSAGSGSGGAKRSRRGRGSQRAGEAEDQIGRGIWGGFTVRFYQDEADHPDEPDATFHPGHNIDWKTFTRFVKQEKMPNLDKNWGTTPPADGMKHTFWSMKATGRIFVPKDDTYNFYLDKLDDAGRLILDGKTIIEIWRVQESTQDSGEVFLKRGPHDIRIEYVQGPATAASIKLSWQSKSFPKEVVGVYQKPTDE